MRELQPEDWIFPDPEIQKGFKIPNVAAEFERILEEFAKESEKQTAEALAGLPSLDEVSPVEPEADPKYYLPRAPKRLPKYGRQLAAVTALPANRQFTPMPVPRARNCEKTIGKTQIYVRFDEAPNDEGELPYLEVPFYGLNGYFLVRLEWARREADVGGGRTADGFVFLTKAYYYPHQPPIEEKRRVTLNEDVMLFAVASHWSEVNKKRVTLGWTDKWGGHVMRRYKDPLTGKSESWAYYTNFAASKDFVDNRGNLAVFKAKKAGKRPWGISPWLGHADALPGFRPMQQNVIIPGQRATSSPQGASLYISGPYYLDSFGGVGGGGQRDIGAKSRYQFGALAFDPQKKISRWLEFAWIDIEVTGPRTVVAKTWSPTAWHGFEGKGFLATPDSPPEFSALFRLFKLLHGIHEICFAKKELP